MLATSVTASSRVLPVLADTAVTHLHMPPLLARLVERGRLQQHHRRSAARGEREGASAAARAARKADCDIASPQARCVGLVFPRLPPTHTPPHTTPPPPPPAPPRPTPRPTPRPNRARTGFLEGIAVGVRRDLAAQRREGRRQRKVRGCACAWAWAWAWAWAACARACGGIRLVADHLGAVPVAVPRPHERHRFNPERRGE